MVKEIDLYNPDVTSTGPLDLGEHEPVDGVFTVRVEVIGTNPDAREPRTFFGVDAFVLE